MQHKFLHCEQHGEGMRHLTRIFQRFLTFMTLMLAVVAPAAADFPTEDFCASEGAYNYLDNSALNCEGLAKFLEGSFERQGCTCKCLSGGTFNFALMQDQEAAKDYPEFLCLDDGYLLERGVNCDIPGQHVYFTDPGNMETYGAECCYYYSQERGCITDLGEWNAFIDEYYAEMNITPDKGAYVGDDYAIHECPDGSSRGSDPDQGPCACEDEKYRFNVGEGKCEKIVTLYKNDGTTDQYGQILCYFGEICSFGQPTGVSQTGYSFNHGWGAQSCTSGDTSFVDPAERYYACKVPNPYIITLDATDKNAQAGTTAIYTKYNTGVYLNSNRTLGMTTASNPVTVPSLSGGVFLGYYEAQNGTTQYINQNGYITQAGINAAKSISNDTKWYAKWQTQASTVTIALSGGTGGSSSISSVGNVKYLNGHQMTTNSNPVAVPSESTGKAFLGYYSAQSGGAKYIDENGYITAAGINVTVSGNTTWYAQFSSTCYVINLDNTTYCNNVGNLPTRLYRKNTCSSSSCPIYTNASCTTQFNGFNSNSLPSKTNATFNGYAAWWTSTAHPEVISDTGSLSVTSNDLAYLVTVPWKAICSCDTGYQGNDSVSTNIGNATPNACARGATITLDANGGSINDNIYAIYTNASGVYKAWDHTSQIGTGTNCSNPVGIPSKSGNTFMGYFGSQSSGTKYIDENGCLTSNGNSTGITYASNQTWYAHWTPTTYTVTYNAGNGGSGSIPGGTAYAGVIFNAATPSADTIHKQNATFQGWAVSGTSPQVIWQNGIWSYTENKTFTAQWLCNAGFKYNSSTYACEPCGAGTYKAEESNATSCANINAGYFSTGCGTTATGGVCNNSYSGGVCESGYSSAGSGTSASCTACATGYATSGTSASNHDQVGDCKATVVLNKNGGTGNIQNIGGETDSSIQCSQGTACSFGSASGLTQTGYTFKTGWGTSQNCTSTTYSFTNPTGTYYACKTAKTYTVTYSCGTGTGTKPADATATYNTTFTPAANTCSKTGYSFTGWLVSGTTTVVSAGFNWEYTENKTLTAQWSQNVVNITLNKNNGTGTCATSVSCDQGGTCTLPQWDATSCNITNGNKIFVGWSTSSSATSGTFTVNNANTATYYAVWATPSCNISNAASANPTTTTTNEPKCSVTCGTGYHFGNGANSTTTGTVSGTAGNTSVSSSDACVLNQYTVTFKTGNTTVGTMSVNHGEATTLRSISSLSSGVPAALKSNGWNFDGWATQTGTSTISYSDEASVAFTGDTTLYGIWKRDITYNYYSNNTTLKSSNKTQYYRNTSGTAAGPTSINLPAINTVTTWAPFGWVTSTISTSPTGNVSSQTSETPAYNSAAPTYYALYSRTPKLVYNGNGNTGGSTTQTTGTQYYTAGVGAHTLNMNLRTNGFTKLGHTFDGWRLGSDVGELKTEGESITFPNKEWTSGSVYNIYATWAPKTIGLEWDSNAHGTIDPTQCVYGTTITMPSPTDTGYTFSEWKTPNDSSFGAGASMKCDETSLGTEAINGGNATIVAQWTQNTYKLTVNAGRGIASVVGEDWIVAGDGKSMYKNVVYNEETSLSADNFVVMGGYESELIYTKTSGAGTLSGSTFTSGLGDATITVQSVGIVSPTVSLSRKWAVATYNYPGSINDLTATFGNANIYDGSLTIQYNFGISGASNSSSCAAVAYTYSNTFSTLGTGATTVTKNVPATEYLGYKCYTIQAKVCDSTGCSATTTSSALELGNLQRTITFKKVDSDTSLSGTSPAYARYGTNLLYTGATESSETNMPTAYKTNSAQVFKGWYTASSGGTQVYNANTATLQPGVSSITDSSSKWIVTSDKDLYAQYEACSCTKGSNVASCTVNTASGKLPKDNANRCSYTYTCASGYYTAGNSGSGTFNGAAGIGTNTSPACGAGSYSITYELNGGTATGTYQTTAVTGEVIHITTPTHPHGTFNGWAISGMDTNTHEYGATSSLGSSSTAQSLTVGATIEYFKNLRKSSGNVIFTAKWTCATGYEGNSCTIRSFSCTAGQYLPKNTVECASCPAGKYCANSGTYQFSTTNDQGITGTCTAGNYAAGGATSCSACAANANSSAGASYCVCKPGYSIGGGANTTQYSTTNPSGSTCDLRSYTITLNKNGGSGKIASDTAVTQNNATMTCTYTQTCTLPTYTSTTLLSKGSGTTAKMFLGWSTTQNTSDDATSADLTTSYTLSTTGNKTLFAVWGTPVCTKGTGVKTTSVNSVSGNKTVCNRSSSAGYYCSATETGTTAGVLELKTTCTKATAGYYAAEGATNQTKCGFGKYSSGGTASCTNCPSLTNWTVTTTSDTSTSYSACYATRTPENCHSGTVKRTASGSTGYNTTVVKVTDLTANAGYYVNSTNTACLACVTGAISATGETQCVACQNGTTTTGSGQSSCNANCPNATGVSSWANATWNSTNNTVSNLCTIGSMSSYTITLDNNNGSGGESSVSAQYGSAMPTIETLPTRTGYQFAGYWDEADGGTQYYNSNGTSARNWDKTSNDTLYAHWNIMSYEITIVAGRGIDTIAQPTNGGWTGSGTATLTKTLEYGTTVDLSQFTPTRKAGYTGTGYTVTGAGNLDGSTFTVDANTATITISATGIAAPTASISMSGVSGSTRTLGYNSGTTTTLVGTNTTNYDSGITLSYSYGNSTSATGTYTYSSTNTVSSTAYHGTRYHKVKITASDGTLTSTTTTSSGYVTINLNNTKVIFNPNTGTLSGTSPLYVWKDNAALRTTVGGTGTGTVPSATKQGYTFKGWYTQSSGGTQIYNASGNLSTATVSGYISGGKWNVANLNDITLYAQYEASGNIAYTVKHYTQNLTGNAYTLESTVTGYGTTGATLTLSNLTHSITGFTSPSNGFAGTATNGTTKPSSGAVTTTTILANGNRVIDLYYTRNSYEVSETHGTGIASVTGAGTYLFGASVTLTPTVSNGYTFTNWTDNNNSNTQVSTDAAYTFTMPANDVSYRANATPNSYNITLNKQSGTGGTSSISVTYGYTMPAITRPTRGTYTFGGYYTGTSGSGTKYYNADGTSAKAWAETNVTTLYAKWTACAACAPGNGANCSLSVVSNACKYETSCKEGYSNIQNNGKYNPSCTANTINITLDKNGGTGICGGVSGVVNGEMTCTYDSPCNAPVYADTCNITNGTNILTGWTKSNGDVVALGGDITNITTGAATTLTAQWEQCAPCNANNANSVNCSVSVVNNQCVWTTSCKTGYGNPQNPGTANASCTPNTITLSWTPDTTHGTISNAPASCTYGSTFTAATMTPKSGYTFTNWSVNGKTFASGATNIPCNQNQLGVASGTATINPGFTTNTYNVSYNCNGGTAQSTLPATTSVSYGASYTTAANTVCTRTGYTLSGWMVGSTSSTDVKNTGEEYQWTYTADKTLYAKWTANTFTVNLNKNGGTGTCGGTSGTMTCTYNGTCTAPNWNASTCNITKGTSRLTGWKKSTDNTVVSLGASIKNIVASGTVTLTAQWTPCTACNANNANSVNCSVSVESNQCKWTTSCMDGYHDLVDGGTANASCTANTISLAWDNNGYGTQPTTPATCTYGQNFTAPSMSAGGQTFNGWKRSNTTLNGNTQYVCNYTNLGTYDGSAAFTAQWNANTYTVTYACGAGTGTPPSTTNISATYGSPFTAAANTCTKTGYHFTGWAVSNTGTPSTIWQNGSTWRYEENKTFTAQWSADSFKVRYAKGNTAATGTTPADSTCIYSNASSCTAVANPYTYTGYTFGGWACSLTNGGGSCANPTYTAGADIRGATVDGGDITLTAIWNANTITFDWGNGGRGTLPTSKPTGCTYGSTFTMPAAMSATGYTFGGWTLNSTTYAAGATVNCTNTVLGVSSGSVAITGKWTAKTSALTFDENYGTGATKTKTATYGNAMPTLTSAQLPTRAGYTFVGYFDATSGGNQYYKYNGTSFRTWNKNTTAGTTLYARWSANPYTVTFNGNGGTAGTQYTTAIYDKPMPTVQPNLADPANGAIIKYNGCADGKYPYGATTTGMYNVFLPVEPNTTYKYEMDTIGNRQAIYEYNFVVNPDSYTSQGQLSPDRTINGYGTDGLPSDCFTTGANAKMVMLYLKSSDGTTPTNLKIYKVVGATCTHSNVSSYSSASAGVLSSGGTELTSGTPISMATKTNETFNGYFDAATGGNQYYTAGGESNKNWDKASDTILYAQYKSMTVNVSNKSLTYNGASQSCAGGATVTFPLNATITYSSSQNGSYTATAPTLKNVSQSPITVYFKATANGYNDYYGNYQCTMAKATMTPSLAGNSKVYDGTALTCDGGEQTGVPASSTITYRTGTTGNYGNAPTVTAVADSKTVYYKITNANYNDFTGSFSCGITNAELAAPTTPTNHLVYNGTSTTNGTAQNCPGVTGVASGASVQYSTTEGGTYGASTPTITNAGQTTVWYKLTKTNYNDKIGSYTCYMDTKEMTVSAPNKSLTYNNGNEQSCANVSVSDPSSGATVKYTDTMGGTYSTTAPKMTNVGSKTIYYQVTATNYTTKTGNYTCAMTQANSQLVLSATSGSVTYPTTTGTFTVTKNTSGGALSVASNNTSVATATISGTTVTVTYHQAGTANITVTSAATGNYTAQTATYVATANNKIININNNSGSGTCLGGSMTCTYGDTCDAPVWGNNSRLPAGYTEVEYIQSNGSQYIDTGYKIKNSHVSGIGVVGTPTTVSGSTANAGNFFGNLYETAGFNTNWKNGAFGLWLQSMQKTGLKATYPASFNANQKYTIKFDVNVDSNKKGTALLWVNNVAVEPKIETNMSINNSGSNFKLFSNGSATKNGNQVIVTWGDVLFTGRLYSLKLYDGDTLEMDLVPVSRKSDGALGVFNRVTNEFYGNSGVGSFTAGPTVTPTGTGGTCEITNGTKVLTGWNTAANGTGTAVALGQNNIGTLNANTLYAVWGTPNCNITKGTGTATTSENNSPVCTVTCSAGYSKLGYMDATTTGFTTSGNPNQTTASYVCAARTYKVTLDPKRYTSASASSGTAPENAGTATYWYRYKTNSPCYYYSTELQLSTDEVAANCIAGTNGNTITAPSGMSGYNTFGGYYTGKTGTGTQYVLGTGVTTNQQWNNVANDSTLYAKWNANTFNVGYSSDVSSSTTPTSCTYGATCNAPTATAVTKAGYTLSHWTCAASSGNCVKATYNPGESISAATTVNGATITLTAVWTPNISGKITLDVNRYASASATNATQTATSNPAYVYTKYNTGVYSNADATTKITKLTSVPTMVGYNFGGLYTDKYTGGTQVANSSGTFLSAANTRVATTGGTATWYAHWTAKQSALTFDENEGTGATKTVTATYGNAMPALTSAQLPTRAGYTFVGYFDATTGGNQYYKNDGTSFQNWNKNTTAGTILYARWTPNSYTVTLNKNASSTDTTVVDTINATFGAAMPVVNASGNALTIPTNSNQIITGYADARSNGVLYYNVNGTNITSAKNWDKTTDNTTLYAQWETCAPCNATNANCTLTVSNNTCTYETSCVAGYHGLVGDGTATPSCTANTYTVQFTTGNNVVLGTQEFTYGVSKALTTIANLDQTKIPVSSTNGWSFYGWGTATTPSTRAHTNGKSVSNLTTENGGTVKLYGIWYRPVYFKYYSGATATDLTTSAAKYQYYRNTSSTAANVSSVSSGVTTFVKQSTYNWEPRGWVLDSTTSSTPTYTTTNSASVTPGKDVKPASGTALYYYALYSRPATIQYNVNGGTGSTDDTTADQYFNAGGTNSVPLNMTLATGTGLSKTNYSFVGWTENSTSGTSYASGATYTYPTATWTTPQSTVTMYANWSQNTVVCSAGQYLPANATACTQCTKGSYCPGGTYNLDNAEHGRTTCPTGYTSDAGASQQTQCYVNCGPGQYKASTTSICENVTANYWGAGGKSFYGSALPRTKCGMMNMLDANGTLINAQLTTTGSGLGANQAADCGRVLHIGDYSLRLRSGTAATPSLKFDVDKNGAVDLWAKMTTTQENMSSTSDKKFKVNYQNQTYYVCDDTTCGGAQGYTELQYIRMADGAFIITDVYPNQDTEFIVDFQSEIDELRWLFGSRGYLNGSTTSQNRFSLQLFSLVNGSVWMQFDNTANLEYGTRAFASNSAARLARHQCGIKNQRVWCDGNVLAWGSGGAPSGVSNFTAQNPIVMGSTDLAGGSYSTSTFTGKIYGATGLVPCRRNADLAVGLCNKSTGAFFGNSAGTGTITAGPNK